MSENQNIPENINCQHYLFKGPRIIILKRKHKIMKKITQHLNKIIRLTLSKTKQETIVWKDLKNLHKRSEWVSGIHEKEKHIETIFDLGDNKRKAFHYFIYDNSLYYRVEILEQYIVDRTTDIFILAQHFNNLLNNGTITINTREQSVDYFFKTDIIIPLIRPSEIYKNLICHFEATKDIFKSFERLIIESEEPALIIADLLRNNQNSSNN